MERSARSELVGDDVVSAGHRLADAAKVGDWKTVFELLDDPTERVDVNWWRPGGTAWFTVLHQAAWPFVQERQLLKCASPDR